MTFLLRVIDRINDVLGAIAMVFLVVMIGDMLYEVVSRRVFGAPTLWAYDISYMLNGVGFMFAAGYTLRRNGHVRIDFLSTRLKRKNQDLINMFVYFFLVFPALSFLIMGAYQGWLNAFLTNQLEPASTWQPLLWPLYAGILIGFVSFALQGIAEFIRHWRAVLKPGRILLRANSFTVSGLRSRISATSELFRSTSSFSIMAASQRLLGNFDVDRSCTPPRTAGTPGITAG